MIEPKDEIDIPTIIIGDFNILLLINGRSSKLKISYDLKDFNKNTKNVI